MNNQNEIIEKQKLKDTLILTNQNLEEMEFRYSRLGETIEDEYVLADMVRNYSVEIIRLRKALLNPYFARIDFKENNMKEVSNYYIGKTTIFDGADIEVVDWRAPISSMYYESAVGDASYVCPEGTIAGELSLKRNYQIDKGILIGFRDIDIASDDELLQEYLSVNANDRLKNIVATIQSEQNKIIRADMNKPLIVQGVAGSGKTTVALHRIAYLLYTYEKILKPEECIIIAPNKFFLDYISNVLPDLGVDYVRQETFEDFALSIIKQKVNVINPNKQLTKMLSMIGNDEKTLHSLSETAKFKMSFRIKNVIDEYLADMDNSILPKEDFKIGKYPIITYDRLQEAYLQLNENVSVFQRIDRLKNFMMSWLEKNSEILDSQIVKERSIKLKKLSIKYNDEIPQEQTMKIYGETDLILKELRKGGKKFVLEYIKMFKKTTVLEHYKNIFSDAAVFTKYLDEDCITAMCESTRKNIKKKSVEYEDLPALMYLQYKIYGLSEKFSLKHVIIDEAQDLGEFIFYVLRLILGSKSMTILGDIAQGIYSYRGTSDWNDLNDAIFHGEAGIEYLQKSYRTTIEIMEEANKVLSHMKSSLAIEPAIPVIRHGSQVRYLKTGNFANTVSNLENRINELKNENHKNIAIIAKTDDKCNKIYKYLKGKNYDLNILSMDSTEYISGINIVPAYLAKGLEFDAVILIDVCDSDYSDNEIDVKLLYVSMTRAMHSMDIFYQETLTRLIT